jgi:site-specific recombinase XerD
MSSAEFRVQALKGTLDREQLGAGTVILYLQKARQFLAYLDRQQILLERATQRDLDSFIAERLRIYRKRFGRSPRRPVHWRCEYTPTIHRLLCAAQGQWPPPSPVDADLQGFEAHLIERGLDRRQVQVYRKHACQFLNYLNQRGISVAVARTADVDTYFEWALRIYRKRKPNDPSNARRWRKSSQRAVHGFLRFSQGEWPPGSGRPALVLARFRAHLDQHRYSRIVVPSYISAARQFLRYLNDRSIPAEQARPQHVESFVQAKLERFEQKHGALPMPLARCRTRYSTAIHTLLRMLSPDWPSPEPPANDRERFQQEVLAGYGHWLVDVRGLSRGTLRRDSRAALMFLHWLGDSAGRDSLPRLSVPEIDRYLSWRMPRLRRATRKGVSQSLRSFLRYLHSNQILAKDLAPLVSGPMLCKFDEIPRAFTKEQVKALLDTTRKDKTPAGLRDHAILMLLATYGLRAGEVVRLRLDDIDWRAEKLHVQQSKTGNELFLPLLPAVGDALLNYLRRGRPQTELREVFLRVRAPLGPFSSGSSLHTLIQHRIKQAGIQVQGRHGAHAFRFARAVSLLRAGVPMKAIGDLLGHRSATSTQVYLRLATEDLRAISIEVQVKEDHAELARRKQGVNYRVFESAQVNQPRWNLSILSITATTVPKLCEPSSP